MESSASRATRTRRGGQSVASTRAKATPEPTACAESTDAAMVLARTEEPSAAPRRRVGEYDDDSPQPLALARAGGADDYRAAAAVRLGDDVRHRRVLFNAIITDMAAERSDLVRCIQLAMAKLAFEELHPETRQGAAPGAAGGGKKPRAKDPESGSFVASVSAGTGWSRTTIYRWVAIGSGICASAYELALGTPLANKIGMLERLAQIAPERQVDVARDYNLNLARQAARKLEQYTAELAQDAGPATNSGNPVAPAGEGEDTPATTPTSPRSQPEPLDASHMPADAPPPNAAIPAASILAALGVATEADALSWIARMRHDNEAMHIETARLRKEIVKLERQRDILLDASAIGAVLKELDVPDVKAALQAIKELKSHAVA